MVYPPAEFTQSIEIIAKAA